jgi:hypothetical protein
MLRIPVKSATESGEFRPAVQDDSGRLSNGFLGLLDR